MIFASGMASRTASTIRRVGAIDEEWSLGPNAFGNANGRYLSTLMRRADAPLPSRWASILLRRALLTPSRAPPTVNPVDWVAERAWLLLRMGEDQLEVENAGEPLSPEQLAAVGHRFHHQLLLKAPTMAVLATLMLRGPQTPAERRGVPHRGQSGTDCVDGAGQSSGGRSARAPGPRRAPAPTSLVGVRGTPNPNVSPPPPTTPTNTTPNPNPANPLPLHPPRHLSRRPRPARRAGWRSRARR